MITLISIGLGALIILGGFMWYARVNGGCLSLAGLILVIMLAIGGTLVLDGFGVIDVIPAGAP